MEKFMSTDAVEWHRKRMAEKDARIVELHRRLFECESAMLLGHEAAMLKYMEQYPEPIEKPAS